MVSGKITKTRSASQCACVLFLRYGELIATAIGCAGWARAQPKIRGTNAGQRDELCFFGIFKQKAGSLVTILLRLALLDHIWSVLLSARSGLFHYQPDLVYISLS